MAIDILNFPSKALNDVCLFLSDKSLMQMRKMCKSAKTTVDNLYCTRDPLIRYIEVFELPNERVSITALFKRARDSILWKFCVLSAKSELKLTNLAHFRTFESEATIFDIVENIDDTVKLIAHLKQFFQRTVVNRLQFKNTSAKMIRAFESFLGEKCIPIVEMFPKQGIIDESFYCLLRKCQVEQVQLSYSYAPNHDCYVSILRIATIVVALTLRTSEDTAPKLPMNFIRDILSRKCKDICMIGWNAKYSTQEISNLIQIFHTLEKKISITLRIETTNYSEETENIGLYSLVGREWYVEINHVDFLLDFE